MTTRHASGCDEGMREEGESKFSVADQIVAFTWKKGARMFIKEEKVLRPRGRPR
jgi:hypothetical protein